MNHVDAIEQVLKHEGGFVNNPADKGGATNFGITQKVFESFKGRKVTLAEMQSMSKSDAIAIYKKNYWDKIGGDRILKYSIAFSIFDQAVNRGPGTAIKQAQRVAGLSQSGVMDQNSITKLNFMDEKTFLDSYLAASADAYRAIAAKNPSQNVFLSGWLNRVDSLKNYTAGLLGNAQTPVSIAAVAVVGILIFFYLNSPRRV